VLPIGAVAAGLAMLAIGSMWLVDGAVAIARVLGLSELVIGLTIIAAGTSLPEIATSVIAGIRGQRDIAVGNVVGSNIYNILMVLGVCAMLAPNGLPVPAAAINFDLPVMLAVCVACFPIFFTGHAVHRWQGALFLAYWVAYTTYVVLAASHHDSATRFGAVMTAFVIPPTVVMLLVVTLREFRARRRRRRAH
jgi:cation:H+ antiporter